MSERPLCVAPTCGKQALQRIILCGPNGEFAGDLCSEHVEALESVMPANFKSSAMLVAIVLEDLQADLEQRP